MTHPILVADLLCGAGGSSTGCERALNALGLEMDLVCLNHWPVAIETHSKNHPRARHFCQDVATVRPHRIVPEGYLDLLMASPTCTHHSVARGGKPTSDQQRSDPWHIITWFTELRVNCAIIENVWEFTGWCPVNPKTGKPIKERKGEYFRAWVDTIWKLGATAIEWRKLNAANYGGATTRARFIMIIRFDGKPIVWPEETHARVVPGQPLPPGKRPWRPARDIIDWNIKGKSIFTRAIPLAPKTLARILAGALKFGWPQPFIDLLYREIARSLTVHLQRAFARRNAEGRHRAKRRMLVRDYIARLRHFRIAPEEFAKGGRSAEAMLITLRRNGKGRAVDQPVPTIAAGGTHIALAQPVLVNMKGRSTATGIDAPAPTQTSLARHLAVAEPFILNRQSDGHGETRVHSVDEPSPTATASGAGYLVEPFIMATGSTGAPRAVEDPVPTVTTGGAGSADPGCAGPMLVEPFIATVAHGNDVGDETANERRVHSVENPLGTIHAGGGKYAVVEPFILSRHGDGAPRSVDEPTPTQVAKHSHCLISPYYSRGSGETCNSVEEPLPTVTSKARFGMVVPITHSDSANRARDVESDPLPTLTTAHRGELAFVTAQFGEREGQAPRVHDLEQPLPTVTATGHVNLVEGVAADGTRQYDILFRMLEPHELAAAMGFNREEQSYEFAGNKTEQVKQIGNAVSVELMEACVKAVLGDLARPIERRAVA